MTTTKTLAGSPCTLESTKFPTGTRTESSPNTWALSLKSWSSSLCNKTQLTTLYLRENRAANSTSVSNLFPRLHQLYKWTTLCFITVQAVVKKTTVKWTSHSPSTSNRNSKSCLSSSISTRWEATDSSLLITVMGSPTLHSKTSMESLEKSSFPSRKENNATKLSLLQEVFWLKT